MGVFGLFSLQFHAKGQMGKLDVSCDFPWILDGENCGLDVERELDIWRERARETICLLGDYVPCAFPMEVVVDQNPPEAFFSSKKTLPDRFSVVEERG